MKNKKILLIIGIIVLILIIITFFYFNTYKNSKSVNNIDKSNIKDYILNISSYEAKITVTVNISGLKTIYDGNSLKIENTKLNLSHIYDSYEYISDNALDLYTFIQNYKNSADSEYEEFDTEVVMRLTNKNGNRFNYYQDLYIDKNTALPKRMEITDKNQNLVVYIEYNEISFNSTSKEEILAFSLEEIKTNL